MFSKKNKLLKKINPNVLQITPKLTGEDGSIIDLDSDFNSLGDGAKKLKLRFFKNYKFNEQKTENNVANTHLCSGFERNEENCGDTSEKNTLVHDNIVVEERPGRKWQKLKIELLRKMSDKWEEEYKKRVEANNYSLINHEIDKVHCGKVKEQIEKDALKASEDSNGNKIDNEKQCNDISSSDISGSDADDEIDVLEAGSEDEEVELADFTKIDNDNIENVDNDDCSLIPAYQPGGGLLFGGSELTQNDNSLPQNLFSPSLKLDATQPLECKSFGGNNEKDGSVNQSGKSKTFITEKSKLFQSTNDIFDLDDALEFCSGKFPDSQVLKSQSHCKNSNLLNQERENLCLDVENDSEELLEIGMRDKEGDRCENSLEYDTGKTDTNLCNLDILNKINKIGKSKIIHEENGSEDILESQVSEVSEASEASEQNKYQNEKFSSDEEEIHCRSRYLKKKVMKNLCFSDDEESYEKEGSLKNDYDTNSADDSESEKDFEQGDVNYDSEENEIVNPKTYFEKEAELSGSEDWSDDEDERGLDEYEIEEGDVESFDNDQVKSQLEKIHIRRVLDDDIREVRFIQEILFEDGDLHSDGKKRDRKFKWKNLGTFEDRGSADDENDKIGGNSSDEDYAEEEEMRKVRHQKTLFLLEKKKKKHSDDDIVDENFPLVKVTSFSHSARDFVNGKVRTGSPTCASFPESQKPFNLFSTRGSFLKRNEEFLSKLAKVTSSVTDNVMGPKHSKNFVFTSKSPKKVENLGCKRQNEDKESLKQQEKRMKMMSSETRPSILELLI